MLIGSSSAMAANFSFTGSFLSDSDAQYLTFSLPTDSTSVVFKTLSLNGGVNAAGVTIAGGGFNPYLSLWNQNTGAWIYDTSNKNVGDEAVLSNAGSNPYGALLAGNYTLVLTQYDNVALGSFLIEGFAADDDLATFGTTPFTGNGGGGSGHWAVDILNVPTATLVPEPEQWAMIVLGLPLIGWVARRRTINHLS